ncbi:MAG: hypothetical protein KC419_04715, partial [Anaerolineales bacterium]|nr:hypothetical protein [Anaerolineales bacterium]
QTAVLLLAAGSLALTVRDYVAYGQDAETAFLFETAALEMAERMRAETAETPARSAAEVTVYMDRWFWDEPTQKGWPTVPYIVDLSGVTLYRPEFGVPPAPPGRPVAVYAWELGDLSFVPTLITPPAVVTAERGSEARLDLLETSFPLYVRYHIEPVNDLSEPIADFGHQFLLHDAVVSHPSPTELEVTLFWEAGVPALSATKAAVSGDWTAFVHLVGPAGLVAQDDAAPAAGLWAADWWQSGIVLADTHRIVLSEPFDSTKHQIMVGWYDAATITRLPVYNVDGELIGDSFPLGTE